MTKNELIAAFPELVEELIQEGIILERTRVMAWLNAAAMYHSEPEVVPVIQAGSGFDLKQAHDLLPPIEDSREELESFAYGECSESLHQAANDRYNEAVGKLPT